MTLLAIAIFFIIVAVTSGIAKTTMVLSNRWEDRKEIELPKAEVVTAEMCSLYEIRHTQLKMLDAGILTDEDISVCSDLACPNCKATRETQQRNLRRVTLREYKRLNQEMLAQRMAEAQENQRIRQVGGFELPVPDSVPSFANAVVDYDPKVMRNMVVWRWTDPASGKQFYKKQFIAREYM